MNLLQLNRASSAAIGFVIGVVVLVAATVALKFAVVAPAINADRSAVRSQALAEMTATEEKALNTLVIADRQRDILHLPIETALKLAAQKWPDAAPARADLATRVAKATVAVKPVSVE